MKREKNMSVLGSRFVYKSNRKPDGTIYRWKARLVCQGFKQIEGIDFHDTFSSQARLPSIKLLLFLVNMYDLVLIRYQNFLPLRRDERRCVHGTTSWVC